VVDGAAMSDLKERGVDPSTLLNQIYNTAPWIFESPLRAKMKVHSYVSIVMNAWEKQEKLGRPLTHDDFSHIEYFKLCVAAHYTTCATPVPTDVDNQIRFKLWSRSLTAEDRSILLDFVLSAQTWDDSVTSVRWVKSPQSGERLSGHHGEWFSIAVAAYAAHRKQAPEEASRVAQAIRAEVKREAQIYADLRDAGHGKEMLIAATIVAHNLGDLSRVFEQWSIEPEDSLRTAVFELGHADKGAPCEARVREGLERSVVQTLEQAGELNKALMAAENHRFFALRKPKSLRKSPEFLIPNAPFFEEWGARVAKHPLLSERDLAEVVETLVEGWEKLEGTTSYIRALWGIVNAVPGGMKTLTRLIPAKLDRKIKQGEIARILQISAARFEEQWVARAYSRIGKKQPRVYSYSQYEKNGSAEIDL
jgi:hypothetical protein